MSEHNEGINKETKTIKKNQILELKNKTELKNSLEKFNNRLDKALKNQ